MITIIPFKEKKANIFNVKKDLNELQKFIDLYNLESKGIHKSFFKNNCLVISNEFITKTYKIKLKDSYSKNNYLYIDFDKELINNFTFYDSDYEEEYILYENIIDSVIINVKVYPDYFELEYNTDDLDKFNKLIL
tara:strand:+ start:114 stop:518 length:405 start_codon:yes stop_codon:yes gene_type:complete